MEAGKHVLCEKAFTVNAAQTERLVAMAREKDLFLVESMWTRYFPVTTRVRRALHEEYAIGKVLTVHCLFGFFDDGNAYRLTAMDCAGGALLDIGVYAIFAVSMAFGGLHLADNAIEQLTTSSISHPKTGCDALTKADFQVAGDRSASIVW